MSKSNNVSKSGGKSLHASPIFSSFFRHREDSFRCRVQTVSEEDHHTLPTWVNMTIPKAKWSKMSQNVSLDNHRKIDVFFQSFLHSWRSVRFLLLWKQLKAKSKIVDFISLKSINSNAFQSQLLSKHENSNTFPTVNETLKNSKTRKFVIHYFQLNYLWGRTFLKS